MNIDWFSFLSIRLAKKRKEMERLANQDEGNVVESWRIVARIFSYFSNVPLRNQDEHFLSEEMVFH